MSSVERNTDTYRGRFAPSPTGSLHIGSLVAAVASYLEARVRKGSWLVRIEDLDPPREVPGASDDILRSLEKHGLHWDETVEYQSQRHAKYLAALESLQERDLTYACICSRKDINEQQQGTGLAIYPGTCRNTRAMPSGQHAIRIKTDAVEIGFIDRILGRFSHNIGQSVGDFVLKRADGWFAYQLAVVVDDAEQKITDVVRGADLLDNTPRQIFLQQLLGVMQPDYAHVPVVTNQKGEKLSKQTSARAVDNSRPVFNLWQALELLGQNPPTTIKSASLQTLWEWALQHWDLHSIPTVNQRELDS